MCALTAQMMPLYHVKNFVNFGPVTPEKTGLICILFYDMAKRGSAMAEGPRDSLSVEN